MAPPRKNEAMEGGLLGLRGIMGNPGLRVELCGLLALRSVGRLGYAARALVVV